MLESEAGGVLREVAAEDLREAWTTQQQVLLSMVGVTPESVSDSVKQVLQGTIRIINWFGTAKEHTEVVKGVVRDCYEQRRKRWLASLVSPEVPERTVPRAELHAVGRCQRQALGVAGICSSQEAATELRLLQFLLEQESGRPTGLITEGFEQDAPDLEVLVAAVRSDCWGRKDYVSFLHRIFTSAGNVRVVAVALDANALANHMSSYSDLVSGLGCLSGVSGTQHSAVRLSAAEGSSPSPVAVCPKLVKVTTASTACTASDPESWRPGGLLDNALWSPAPGSGNSLGVARTNFVRVASASSAGTIVNLPDAGPVGSEGQAPSEAGAPQASPSPGESSGSPGAGRTSFVKVASANPALMVASPETLGDDGEAPTGSGSTVFSLNIRSGSASTAVPSRIPSLSARGWVPVVEGRGELELDEGCAGLQTGSLRPEGSWALASVNEDNDRAVDPFCEQREMVGTVVCSLARHLVFPFNGDGSMRQVLTDAKVIGVELRRGARERGRGGEPHLDRLVEIVPV
mmetsp:Transcript_3012/g.5940  ORF Transcript_3012/g.5940 Transcript_3012/m.5940 type:complete len:518 (+) Transcript_3012:3-1556(+)